MTQTFQTLVSAVKAASEVQDADFDTFVKNTAFDIVEERLTRDLDVWGLVQNTSVATAIGNAYVTKPSGTRVIKSITYISAGVRSAVFLRTDEYIRDFWPIEASVGEPKYYANYDGSTLLVGPTPRAVGSLLVSYVVRPSALTSSSQETNWFTQFAPNALFYGVMTEASRFMKNFSAVQVWEASYQMEVQALRNESRRTRRDDQQAPGHAVAENTLTGKGE